MLKYWNVSDLFFFSHAESELFDASQYAFFGKDVTEEVELGGLEDEDGYMRVHTAEFIEEDFFHNKKEVIFQFWHSSFRSKFQIVATNILKYEHFDHMRI